jgi:hypothetical protein
MTKSEFYSCCEKLKSLVNKIEDEILRIEDKARSPFSWSNREIMQKIEVDLEKILQAFSANHKPKKCWACTTLTCAMAANHLNCLRAIVEIGDSLSDWSPRTVGEEEILLAIIYDRTNCLEYLLGRYPRSGKLSQELTGKLIRKAIVCNSQSSLGSLVSSGLLFNIPQTIRTMFFSEICDVPLSKCFLDGF